MRGRNVVLHSGSSGPVAAETRMRSWAPGTPFGCRRASWIVLFGVLALLPLTPQASHAAWPHDAAVNVPICTAMNDQGLPTIVTDGAGGVIITWADNRSVGS